MNTQKYKDLIQEVKRMECQAINDIPDNNPYHEVAQLLAKVKNNQKKVVVSGIGKASGTSKRYSQLLCSIGIPTVHLNALNALYGEIGLVTEGDVLILMDNTGHNPALVDFLNILESRKLSVPLVYITGNPHGVIVKRADYLILTGKPKEVCVLGLMPSTTMSVMGVILNIIFAITQRIINFNENDFKGLHFIAYYGLKQKQLQMKQMNLSQKELLVLAQMQFGVDRKNIAKYCGLTPSGVDYHKRNIFKKLGVHNSKDAVQEALMMGILKD